jgi:hypothetical protein
MIEKIRCLALAGWLRQFLDLIADFPTPALPSLELGGLRVSPRPCVVFLI